MVIITIYTLLVLIATFVMGTKLYKKSGTRLDIKIKDFVEGNRTPQGFKIMSQITRLANVETIFILVLVLTLFYINNGNHFAATSILLAAVFSTISSHGLKIMFKRTRPVKRKELNYIGYSFPSGHSTIGICFYTVIGYLMTQVYGFNPIVTIFAFMLGLVVAFSRIFLSAHWTIDVLFGILLGTACTAWVIFLFDQGVDVIAWFLV